MKISTDWPLIKDEWWLIQPKDGQEPVLYVSQEQEARTRELFTKKRGVYECNEATIL